MAVIRKQPFSTKIHHQTRDLSGTIFHFWMKRDSQRRKCYNSEFAWMAVEETKGEHAAHDAQVFKGSVRIGHMRADRILDELETNPDLAFITDSPRYFRPDVTQSGKNGKGGSYHPAHGITLSQRADTYTLVHEWAHHATELMVQYPHAPHGKEFTAILIRAVSAVWGSKSG